MTFYLNVLWYYPLFFLNVLCPFIQFVLLSLWPFILFVLLYLCPFIFLSFNNPFFRLSQFKCIFARVSLFLRQPSLQSKISVVLMCLSLPLNIYLLPLFLYLSTYLCRYLTMSCWVICFILCSFSRHRNKTSLDQKNVANAILFYLLLLTVWYFFSEVCVCEAKLLHHF